MDSKLIKKLEDRYKEGTLRSLSCFDSLTDFFSNDYLGLASEFIPSNTKRQGSTGSRLISGTTQESLDCEKWLEDHFNVKGALIFNSGYDANLGLFSSVPQRGDTILYDEDIHASVRDGIRLSLAKSYSFKHNDVSDLKRLLKLAEGEIYVAVESLYSMNGDLAPLKEMAEVCSGESVHLIVDEAHSAGVFGEKGRGLIAELGLEELVFARLITFGKAFGSHGAAVLGSEVLKKYLSNFARSFIYTTALPPEAYKRIHEMVNHDELDSRIECLRSNIQLFRMELNFDNLSSDKNSPIQMIHFGDVSKAKQLAEICTQNGFAVKPIFSPTVPVGKEGLRISIHSTNTTLEIKKLVGLINGFLLT